MTEDSVTQFTTYQKKNGTRDLLSIQLIKRDV